MLYCSYTFTEFLKIQKVPPPICGSQNSKHVLPPTPRWSQAVSLCLQPAVPRETPSMLPGPSMAHLFGMLSSVSHCPPSFIQWNIPSLIHPVFKTAPAAHLLWSLSWLPRALLFRSPLNVPHTGSHSAHCTWVHMFSFLSQKLHEARKLILFIFVPTVPSIWPSTEKILHKYVLIKCVLCYVFGYFILLQSNEDFWVPALCQVLCSEIGYIPWSVKDRNGDTPSDHCCDRGICRGLWEHRGGT